MSVDVTALSDRTRLDVIVVFVTFEVKACVTWRKINWNISTADVV